MALARPPLGRVAVIIGASGLLGIVLSNNARRMEAIGARIDPPPVYRQWWAQIENCSGLHGSFDAVRWHESSAEAVGAYFQSHGPIQAFWVQRGNHIVLLEGAKTSGNTVRHEMLHALINDRGHPPAFYACRGLL